MVYKFFDKKILESLIKKVNSPFIDKIWGEELEDMQLISKFSKGFKFLLCVIGMYSKCAWVILLKDKKALQLLMLFKTFI